MREAQMSFSIEVEGTLKTCAIGQKVGAKNAAEGKIPVLSCEGGCIRGEIARLAANIVAKEERYSRGCHGELLTVPDSNIAGWMRTADKVVLIDGCFLKCHGRVMRNIIGSDRLTEFDALSIYKKYTDLFDIDDVPAAERLQVAQEVAEAVLADLG